MRRIVLCSLVFVALGLPTAAQDGLPLPTLPGGSAPVGAPAAGPQLEGTWRVQGRDEQRGLFTGVMTFERQGGRLRYSRRVRFEAGGPEEADAGLADLDRGMLYTSEVVTEGRSGFLQAFDGKTLLPGQAPAPRRARYRLRAELGRWEGVYYRERGGRGVERLDPVGAGAANNAVELLIDGGEAFPRIRAALEQAERSIVVETFIWRDDRTGHGIAELLAERAEQGVRVRCLIDGMGDKLSDGTKRRMREAGVELITHHTWGDGIKNSLADLGRGLWNGLKGAVTGSRPAPREKRGVLNHDHRKIIVVDGRVGFTGGMNMGKEYEYEWHDAHARVEGSAAARMLELFEHQWQAAGGQPADERDAPQGAPDAEWWPGNLQVDVVASLPGVSTDIKDRYLREISAARHHVFIENAYFLDDGVIHALQRRTRAGVRTVVIIPNDEDHDVKVVRDAFAWVQNDVVRSGVELYKYRGRMTHMKAATFDGRTATVGSANLDNMALERLAEANIFVPDAGFTRVMEQRVFEVDIPRSDRVREEELGWWKKVKGGVLHFFRSFL